MQVKLLDQQIRAMGSDRRVVALVGGTGFGKTWLGPHWHYKRMRKLFTENGRGPRFMAIGMQYERHIINVMQKELTSFYDELRIPYKLVTGKRISFPTFGNSEILFGSAEKPESLEGPHLDGGIWMDEAGYMSRGAWEVAMRRSGFHNAQVYISTIPYLPNWLKREVYEPASEGDPTIEWIACRSIDNPHYNLDELRRAKRMMRPEKFKTIYLGEFSRPFGAIYPDLHEQDAVVDLNREFPNGFPDDWPCYAGFDWGMTAPTVGIWARYDRPQDRLWLFAEYEVNGITLDQHVYNWRKVGLDYIDKGWGDPENPEMIERAVTNHHLPLERANNDILLGVDAVYERIMAGKLRVSSGLKGVLEYMPRYVWDHDPKDDERLLEKPKDPQDSEHVMDALRYLNVGLITDGMTAAPSFLRTTKWGQAFREAAG